MKHPLTHKKRAQAISTAIFFLGLAVIAYMNLWWPGIMLILGISLGAKQFLLGKFYDMGISLLVFVGTFITVQYDISWEIFLPVLFSIGALYVLYQEFTQEDDSQDL